MNLVANRARARLETGRIINDYELLVPVRTMLDHETWVARHPMRPDQLVAISFGTRTPAPAPIAVIPPSNHFVNEIDRGHYKGIAYYVTEWIEGDSLQQLHRQAMVSGQWLEQRTTLPILIELLDALLALRTWFPAAPLVVPTPASVLIDKFGHVKILDGSWRFAPRSANEQAVWTHLEILTAPATTEGSNKDQRISFLPAHNADSLAQEVQRLVANAMGKSPLEDRQLIELSQSLHGLLGRRTTLPDPQSLRSLRSLRRKSESQRLAIETACMSLNCATVPSLVSRITHTEAIQSIH